MIREITGADMVRRIQAERNFPKPQKLTFPTAVGGTKCDRQCRDCERFFYNTRRQYCPHCESYTVWPVEVKS